MELTRFEINTPSTTPPDPNGWVRYWHGYHQMTKVRSEDKIKKNIEQHTAPEPDLLSERKVEIQVFLNIIKDIKKQHINMFELGAGRGDWCLSLAGVVDHKIIPCRAETYRCLALEGEPTHYQWTREHFQHQKINGVAVHGAISSADGTVKYKAIADPASSYGQGIDPNKGNIEVPCYTIDTLIKKHDFDRVDMIHMDVQGQEYEALLGAEKALAKGLIDYLLIGTHHSEKMNARIIDLMSSPL